MEGTYVVTLGGKEMGRVTITKQGLYACFDCRCNLSGEVMYDLLVATDGGEIKLGLLIPEGGSFALKTRLPMKKLGQGSPLFFLQPRHINAEGHFVPVKPDEPFAYLHKLESAYLATQNGKTGLIIK